MTSSEEQEFIRLWQEDASYREIAQALGCALGTVGSRTYALVRQGKIQPRPKGGNYPTLRAQARRGEVDGVSQQAPRVSHRTPEVSKRVSKRVSAEVLPAVPAASGSPEMTPVLQEILQELRTLTQGLAGRVSDQAPPVSRLTPQMSEGVSQGVSLGPREKTERWNLHLPKYLIAHTKAKAQALGVHPSELVAELLRRWLAEGDTS